LIPGFNPRELKKMLKRMGIDVEELGNVEKVEVVLKDKRIVIENPQILVIKTREQSIYQVIGGSVREEEVSTTVSEEDVEFIVAQTGVSREKAREALIKAGGDLAEAILLIKEGRV